jgi:Flp pilus assembly protein TadG
MDALRTQGRIKLMPQRQSGASAIEFAFVLPLLIALTYAMFVYSYVYVVYESINYAAQQGAEAAVAVDPELDDYEAVVRTQVQLTVRGVLSWMPASAQRDAAVNNVANAVVFCGSSGGSPYCPVEATGGTPVVVPITFPLLAPDLFPVLNLPGIGSVPPLPAALVGVGVVLLSGEI